MKSLRCFENPKYYLLTDTTNANDKVIRKKNVNPKTQQNFFFKK